MAKLATSGPRTDLRQGDIFFVDLEPTIGHEQRGSRPVLVISPEDFNLRTQAPVILPITNGGGFAVRLGLAFSLPLHLRTTGVVRCDQPRTVDLTGRGARFVEAVPHDVLVSVLRRFLSVFDPTPETV
jgi:mRNA-degrading endonuclease toxin of MazEF toxin-antitoxin module